MTQTNPPWWRGAAIYQVYPRSFFDSNDDGIGDLAGVTAKLDYIASLHVDAIWLSPFFLSPMRDFGYDVRDHKAVDPIFGSMADFDALITQAHAKGLKMIIDQVWSHVAIEHPWFDESRQSRDNPKADWFVWADAKADGSPPNNWQSWMGGPAWTWDARRKQFYLHNFLREMPDLNFHCPAVQEAILEIAKFWLDRGVDGFRLDTANFYFHDHALPDNPARTYDQAGEKPADIPVMMQRHLHNVCQPENLAFLARVRDLFDQYEDRMTVAEIGSEHPIERMMEYTSGNQRLHTAYSFLMLGDRYDPSFLAETMATWQTEQGRRAWPSWAFSNHDVPRVATRWASGDEQGARLFNALLACLRGTVFIYQGEELGLTQAEIAFEDVQDPVGKTGWPINKGRDGCRTPMPWQANQAASDFSKTTPWLPINAKDQGKEVDVQSCDAASNLNFVRQLLAMRRRHPSMRLGEFKLISKDNDVLIFERVLEQDRVFAAFNLSPSSHEVCLPEELAPFEAALVIGTSTIDHSKLKLAGWSGLVAKLK